jgi:hypothetical protein
MLTSLYEKRKPDGLVLRSIQLARVSTERNESIKPRG